jgi:hypothetical protein
MGRTGTLSDGDLAEVTSERLERRSTELSLGPGNSETVWFPLPVVLRRYGNVTR